MGIKKANTMLALLYVPKFVGGGGVVFCRCGLGVCGYRNAPLVCVK